MHLYCYIITIYLLLHGPSGRGRSGTGIRSQACRFLWQTTHPKDIDGGGAEEGPERARDGGGGRFPCPSIQRKDIDGGRRRGRIQGGCVMAD